MGFHGIVNGKGGKEKDCARISHFGKCSGKDKSTSRVVKSPHNHTFLDFATQRGVLSTDFIPSIITHKAQNAIMNQTGVCNEKF
jgi:hypothetical protein